MMNQCSHGATMASLNQGILERIELPLPPLPVQQRIAGILSVYDELIENSQRRIKILETMARALYREWFVHFRFPGHENHPRVLSPLGEIPQGWEAVSIEDVCERVTDGSHSSPQSVDDGLPMASSKDMHDWGLTMETCRSISRKDFDNLVRNDCKPKRNDILITKDGANYLKYIFVNRAEQDVVLLSSIAILRSNSRVNPHLLAAILSYPENKNRLKNYVTGAAIPRIILKDFKRFQFVLPSAQMQTEWAKRAEPITDLCWRLVDQIQNLRRTRDLLLPRLLSGQIPLVADEPRP
ncbi:restriction endonuclease S subunit [Azoarcus sp. CIB]|nr:restriction endonuclease S subunit [Azoarcus sp. CIB]